MTGTLRLFTIEWRRSVALWFFPLLVLAGGWFSADLLLSMKVAIWANTSAHIGLAAIALAPLMGGVAAWAAGRDQRRGMRDLLATTPRPAPQRDLAALGGLALWGMLAYVAAGAYDVFVSLRNDPWGALVAEPIVVGLLAVIAGAAIGYLAGTLVPSRLVPPLVPIVLFFTMGLLNSGWFWDDPVTNLSPWTLIEDARFGNPNTVFYAHPPSLLLESLLWLAGPTGVAIAAVALYRRRSLITWGALAVSVVVAATGATTLMLAFENPNTGRGQWETRELVASTPVCIERSIPVCVHPAFEPLLAENASQIDLVIEPVLGLSGAPVRAEQLPFANGMYANGTLTIDPIFGDVEGVTLALVQDSVAPGPGWNMQYHLQPEQDVIAIWLARRIDASAFEHSYRMTFDSVAGPIRDPVQDDIDAAVARFNALAPAEQRAWLEANYADLRAGRLDMDDLP